MKRPNGQGAIDVLADGRARIRVVVDGKRRQVGPVFPTVEEARRMLAAWNAARGAGEIVAPSSATLATYGAAWLDQREIAGSKRRAEVRTIRVERSIFGRHIVASDLGSRALTAIEPRDVERFALWLRDRRCVDALTVGPRASRTIQIRETDRPLSRSMQVHALRIVKQILADAAREGVIPRNPAEGVSIAVGGRRARDLSDDWLRAEEIDRLLACEALDVRQRTAYACALGLALRLGDLKRVEIEHVHLDAQVPGPHVAVYVAKSDRWHRVPVLPWLLPWLRRHMEALPSGARFLFPSPDGGAYDASYDFGWAGKRYRREGVLCTAPSALERAGVGRRIRFHDLRGTTATHLALGTWGRAWSLHEVQAMLAHSDQRVTERYVRRAVDTLAAAARSTTDGPGCPGLPMASGDGVAQPAEIVDAPAAIRTRDLSLRKRQGSGAGVEVRPDRLPTDGQPLPMAEGAARAVLAAVAAGTVTREQLEALAAAVLGDERVRLALAVREGGPLAVRRAVELAAVVLEAAPAEGEQTGQRRG